MGEKMAAIILSDEQAFFGAALLAIAVRTSTLGRSDPGPATAPAVENEARALARAFIRGINAIERNPSGAGK